MSASFIAVLILMKVLEISVFIFVPWGITRFILSRCHRDIKDLFWDSNIGDHFIAWLCGLVTIMVCGIIIGAGCALLEVNIVWLTALLG
jgi:hypothetical protein